MVAYHLCGPGKESGEALLKRFKDIRRTLEQGKNSGSHTSSRRSTAQAAAIWHSMSISAQLSFCLSSRPIQPGQPARGGQGCTAQAVGPAHTAHGDVSSDS